MDVISLENPVFATYVAAATLMILKTASMAWLTVYRMMRVNAGFRSPEDVRKTLLNPAPDPKQLEVHDYVDRARRIHANDVENIPFFLVAGFLFTLTDPSLALTQGLMGTYVVTRLLHFAAYLTAQTHDLRASMWTPGALVILFMAGRTLVVAVGAL